MLVGTLAIMGFRDWGCDMRFKEVKRNLHRVSSWKGTLSYPEPKDSHVSSMLSGVCIYTRRLQYSSLMVLTSLVGLVIYCPTRSYIRTICVPIPPPRSRLTDLGYQQP